VSEDEGARQLPRNCLPACGEQLQFRDPVIFAKKQFDFLGRQNGSLLKGDSVYSTKMARIKILVNL